MLLHTWPTKVDKDKKSITLPRHARIPLGLAPGSNIWALCREREPGFHQIMLSPYDPNIWPHMWRLEIQLDDAAGQLNEIIDVLDGVNVKVLHLVSRNAFMANYHFKYFMLDCSGYQSDLDVRRSEFENAWSSLSGLKSLLLLRFMTTMRISSDGAPRLRLEPNLVHWNMAEAEKKGSIGDDRVHNPVCLKMDGKKVCLDGLDNAALAAFDRSDPYAVISTNAKSHVIYCKVVNPDQTKVAHIVIHYNDEPRILSSILSCLKRLKLNIKRTYLKRGLPYHRERTFPDHVRDWKRPCTLNVTVEAEAVFANAIFCSVKQKLDNLKADVHVEELQPIEPEG